MVKGGEVGTEFSIVSRLVLIWTLCKGFGWETGRGKWGRGTMTGIES
jgi:hypothetical protein